MSDRTPVVCLQSIYHKIKVESRGVSENTREQIGKIPFTYIDYRIRFPIMRVFCSAKSSSVTQRWFSQENA